MHIAQHADRQLDLSGLNCPVPVLRCKAALQRLEPGAGLLVTTDNLDATRDIHLLIQRSEVQFLDVRCDERGCHFQIRSLRHDGQARRVRPVRLPDLGALFSRWLTACLGNAAAG